MRRPMSIVLSFFTLFSCIFLSACSASMDERTLFAMNTVMEFRGYGQNTADAFDQIEQYMSSLESKVSRTRTDSEISLLNSAGSYELSEDTVTLLQLSVLYADATDGAFDPTVGSLVDLWSEARMSETMPDPARIAELVSFVGWKQLSLNGSTATLGKYQTLDFGGIAKGYAADIVKDIFIDAGVTSASFSMGGNVGTLGTKPDGSPWVIGIRDPNGTANDYLATVRVKDQFVITSGDYERYFEIDGVRYHHILDPTTGMPVRNGLRSVTIVSDTAVLGDAYSTALFVMGLSDGLDFWREHPGFEAIFITDKNEIVVTEGLDSVFALSDSGGEYTYEIAKR